MGGISSQTAHEEPVVAEAEPEAAVRAACAGVQSLKKEP